MTQQRESVSHQRFPAGSTVEMIGFGCAEGSLVNGFTYEVSSNRDGLADNQVRLKASAGEEIVDTYCIDLVSGPIDQ